MKLAVFTSQYPSRTATFFERDMRGLLEAGIEIDVFPIYPLDSSLWRYSLELGELGNLRERVHHIGMSDAFTRAMPVWRSRAGWLRDAAAALAAAARFGPVTLAKTAYVLPKAWAWVAERAYRYDHVLGYWGNYAGTCAYVFHRLQGRPIPFSIWLHAGTDLYRTPAFMARKLAYADNVLTCCEFNRDYILTSFGGRVPDLASRLHVFHHGLDLEQFPFREDSRAPRRIVAVGRLAAHKGFDFLLWAAHILLTRGVPFEIELVGDGPESAALKALAADLKLERQVTFRGWLPLDGARRAMSEATMLVHPSDGLGDGLPNVVREAMALGTPVIASDVAGIPDAIGGGCGVLVPPKSALALADAIERLLKNPGERLALARAARARAEERFDLVRTGNLLAARLLATRRDVAAPHWAVERRRRPRPAMAGDAMAASQGALQ